jgi:hypothetical protein
MERAAALGLDGQVKQRLVENYKSHFRQMKNRLKTFAEGKLIENGENGHLRVGVLDNSIPVGHHSSTVGDGLELAIVNLQSCVLQPLSIEGNFRKTEQLQTAGMCRVEKRGGFAATKVGKENLDLNQMTHGLSMLLSKDSNPLRLTSIAEQGQNLRQTLAHPPISFRGPMPGELQLSNESSALQAKSCVSTHRNVEVDCLTDAGRAKSHGDLFQLCSRQPEGRR